MAPVISYCCRLVCLHWSIVAVKLFVLLLRFSTSNRIAGQGMCGWIGEMGEIDIDLS